MILVGGVGIVHAVVKLVGLTVWQSDLRNDCLRVVDGGNERVARIELRFRTLRAAHPIRRWLKTGGSRSPGYLIAKTRKRKRIGRSARAKSA